MLKIVVAACTTACIMLTAYVSRATEIDEAAIKAMKVAFDKSLSDPDSAKYKNASICKRDDMVNICGLVNAKNKFGGYTGYTPFIYYYKNNELIIANDKQSNAVVGLSCALSQGDAACSNINISDANQK